jgi:hypothetical protein
MPPLLASRGVRRAASTLVTVLLLVLAGGCGTSNAADTPAPTLQPVGQILWTGNAETGDMSQFQDTPYNVVKGLTPQVVQEPVRGGRYAIRLGITGPSTPADGVCCGSRDEIVPEFPDAGAGDDLYVAVSTYLAPGFPVEAHWQTIVQFKQDVGGSAPVSVNVENGSYRLEGGYGAPSGSHPFTIPMGTAVTGQWVDWVLHVKFSPDPAVGFVEVWRNGALVVPRYAPVAGTLYAAPPGQVTSEIKFGYFRDPTIVPPGTIYIDDARIGTSLDIVRH